MHGSRHQLLTLPTVAPGGSPWPGPITAYRFTQSLRSIVSLYVAAHRLYRCASDLEIIASLFMSAPQGLFERDITCHHSIKSFHCIPLLMRHYMPSIVSLIRTYSPSSFHSYVPLPAGRPYGPTFGRFTYTLHSFGFTNP